MVICDWVIRSSYHQVESFDIIFKSVISKSIIQLQINLTELDHTERTQRLNSTRDGKKNPPKRVTTRINYLQ